MPKSVLTLDDINLLLYSEEPKNTKLYGNLYEILCNLHSSKAVSLEQIPNIDKLAIAAITYNKKTLINTVIKEWFAERVSEEDPSKKVKCGLCNTRNKYLYYIRNRKNGKLLNVGSHCITKFPGIDGYIEQRQQLNQIHKEHKVVTRRNEFYEQFPECEQIISSAENYFSTLPILLPNVLYTKLQDTISRIRLIYTKYVDEGKKPFKSEKSSVELFQLAINQYNKLKSQADSFVLNNKDTHLICKRREIDWLISNNKQRLLQQVSENNGVYTLDTLKHMSSFDYVKEYLNLFLAKNQSNLCKFKKFNGNSMIFSFNKLGYQPAILFSISLSDFMNNIGANCLINDEYTYSSKEILKIAKINHSRQNLESVINYIYNIINKFNYAFLFDDKTNFFILYRKGDKAIKQINPNKFLDVYSQYILFSDDIIKKYLFSVVRSGNNKKWITTEIQAKQGIDDKINRLYRAYKDSYLYNNYYNANSKYIEVITYNTIYNPTTNTTCIDFDKPEYVTIPRNKINITNSQLRLINYAIHISDDSLEPLYYKGNKLLIQDTQSIENNNIIFFVSDDGLNIKRCSTEEEYESIFKHIQIKKNKLQAYGRIVYCLKQL